MQHKKAQKVLSQVAAKATPVQPGRVFLHGLSTDSESEQKDRLQNKIAFITKIVGPIWIVAIESYMLNGDDGGIPNQYQIIVSQLRGDRRTRKKMSQHRLIRKRSITTSIGRMLRNEKSCREKGTSNNIDEKVDLAGMRDE